MDIKDQVARLEELKDPRKVALFCERHHYFGPPKSGDTSIKPHKNCPRCWLVYYFHDLMNTPPSLRAERLELLEETIHHMDEEIKRGRTWNIDRNAAINYD